MVRVSSGFDWSSRSSHSTGRPSRPPRLFRFSTQISAVTLWMIASEASGPVRGRVLPMRIGFPWARANRGRASVDRMAPPAARARRRSIFMLDPPQDVRLYCPYANALSISQPVKKRRSRGIQSIDTGIRLLEVLEKADGPLALKELSARADMDPSSAHRYLASFVRCGLVRQEADSRYDFGPLALHIGLAAVRRIDPIQLIELALPALVAETGYTALLTVWSNRGPTVVHWQRSRNPFVTNLGLGSVLPISRSATGAVLVAFLPEAVTADAIAAEARREDIDRGAFSRAVERARKMRLAFVDSSVVPGLSAVSAPVLQWNGEAAAAVTLIGPNRELAKPSHPAVVALRGVCDRLSRDFGAQLKEAA